MTANVTVIRLVPPNTVHQFVDRETGKVVATATNSDTVNAASLSISVPPGRWVEKEVRTLPEHGGSAIVMTGTVSQETDLQPGNNTAPVVTDTSGGLWMLGVTPVADPVGAPTTGQATSGGTVAAGTYTCGYTWVTPAGESKLSPTAPVTTTTGVSTITLSAIPAIPQGAYGYNLYVSAAGVPGTLYKQNASPFTTGASQTITATIQTNTANPPSASTAGLITATKIA